MKIIAIKHYYNSYKVHHNFALTEMKFAVGSQQIFVGLQDCYAEESWRRLEDMSWRRLEDMSWRRLEDISWKRLEDMSWRRLQDVLETNKSKCVYIFDLPNLHLTNLLSEKSNANPKCHD